MTQRSLRLTLGMAAVLSVVAAAAASAQITFQPSTASFGAQMGGQVLNIQRDSLHNGAASRGPGPAYGHRPPPPRAVTTAYSPDPAVTARVQRQFVDFVRKSSGAAGADAIARAFTSRDLLQSWARQARPDGMRLGDVADAMAEYWVTNWLIAHGRMEAPPATVAGVREQVRDALSRNLSFSRLSNAQRQEMAEVLIYNTLLQGEVFGDAMKRRDAALIARAGDAAVARFHNEAQIDLRAVDLTRDGFMRRG